MSEEQRYEGWMTDSILKKFGITKDEIGKVKEILSMVEIGDDDIIISVGPNIEVKIKK